VVLVEAMAAGTAIVATELSGYRAVARPEEHAVLVPPGHAVALSLALQRVLTDGSLATRLVAAGEARAAEFSMERLAQEYVALYERVIAARRSRRRA
jgi:phosphatidylinositol alpha-mannosyltransferase